MSVNNPVAMLSIAHILSVTCFGIAETDTCIVETEKSISLTSCEDLILHKQTHKLLSLHHPLETTFLKITILYTNLILSSLCIPKVLKSTAKLMDIGSQTKI